MSTSRIVGFAFPGILREGGGGGSMQPGYRRCCGIDVHRDKLTVTVLPPVGRTDVKIKKQEFRTFTRNLKRLRAWLQACQVTEVAMESTGQYWMPVWNILEGSTSKMLLLNPLHVKALEGQKTDAIDSERIGTLLQNHELRGSFVPPRVLSVRLHEMTRGQDWYRSLARGCGIAECHDDHLVPVSA